MKNPPSVSHRGGLTSGVPVWLPERPHPAFAEATLPRDGQVGEGVSPALDAQTEKHNDPRRSTYSLQQRSQTVPMGLLSKAHTHVALLDHPSHKPIIFGVNSPFGGCGLRGLIHPLDPAHEPTPGPNLALLRSPFASSQHQPQLPSSCAGHRPMARTSSLTMKTKHEYCVQGTVDAILAKLARRGSTTTCVLDVGRLTLSPTAAGWGRSFLL